MQGLKRKVVYVALYEAVAIALTAIGFAAATGHELGHSTVLGVISSVMAVVWNLIYNTLFEAWEARQTVKGRSLRRRIAHAIGFEGGLMVFLVPVIAWWLDVGIWMAFVMNLGLSLFLMGYTFVFAWIFDKVFGLPDSAKGDPVHL